MVQNENEFLGNPQVRICEIVRSSGSCGFNLTKSKWDPYPWVSTVENGSPAETAGVQPGDCLLEVNGEDVLGLRVVEVADKVKARNESVTVMLWNSGVDSNCSKDTLCCGPMPLNLQRLSTCMNNILAALECPVCLDTISPPCHQCANGHLICHRCRLKTDKCPVCRLKLFRGRSLFSDQVYNSLIDAFELRDQEEPARRKMLKQKFLGQRNLITKKPDIKISLLSPTSKILSRLLKSGKSSSAENLSESDNFEKKSNLLNSGNEFHVGLRKKSLSSNEIFKMDSQPVSRTTSILSSRPGSGLLDVQSIYTRPASYHGSMEELQKEYGNDESLYQSSQKCYCPCEANCQDQITSLLKHIQENHKSPILQFFKPHIELTLPLNFENSTVILLSCYNTVFILKLMDYFCKTKNNRLWIWKLKSKQDFTASVTLHHDGLVISSEFAIPSIEYTGWQKIIDENHGTLINIGEKNFKAEVKINPNFYE